MTRRRWIADEYTSDRAALTGAHAAHLARTLRAQRWAAVRRRLRRTGLSRHGFVGGR